MQILKPFLLEEAVVRAFHAEANVRMMAMKKDDFYAGIVMPTIEKKGR